MFFQVAEKSFLVGGFSFQKENDRLGIWNLQGKVLDSNIFVELTKILTHRCFSW